MRTASNNTNPHPHYKSKKSSMNKLPPQEMLSNNYRMLSPLASMASLYSKSQSTEWDSALCKRSVMKKSVKTKIELTLSSKEDSKKTKSHHNSSKGSHTKKISKKPEKKEIFTPKRKCVVKRSGLTKLPSKNTKYINSKAGEKAEIIHNTMKTIMIIDLFNENSVMEIFKNLLTFKDYLSFITTTKKIYKKQLVNEKIELKLIKGITQKERRKYWEYKFGTTNLRRIVKVTYENYKMKHSIVTYEMEKDMERLFRPFILSKSNILKLQNVLKAFNVKNNDIGYTQGLTFIAGNLLLMFEEEVI